MGTITIQPETTEYPISLAGREAGICYGSDVEDPKKNYKRGLGCFRDGHGRTMEYAQVYMVIDGFSARVIREFYTSNGGMPTRLQASTRYIDYASGFEYITPPTILNNLEAVDVYVDTMEKVMDGAKKLKDLGVPEEDIANVFPLGMTTTVVCRTNLRNLVDMSRQRDCTRAYWEYRQLMWNVQLALSAYSPEWKTCVNEFFGEKCKFLGYCPEKRSCGKYPPKDQVFDSNMHVVQKGVGTDDE